MAAKESAKWKPANLEPFDTAKLSSFQFGDPDAKSDEVLLSCSQLIGGVRQFLGGSKNIVLGERGAGKSALFRLVLEGKYKFAQEGGDKTRKHLVVGIDDELNYTAISNVIESRFTDKTKRPHGKYRFLWEVYILNRVVERLAEEFTFDEELRTLSDDFGLIHGITPQPRFRLSDLFTSYKLSSGLKIENTGTVTPTISVEPAKDAYSAPLEITDQQISALKDRVRKAIRTRKAIVYVLVDKVDDFVVGLEYQEQKKSIQALLECTQGMRLPELKLKIFLRIDLFKRLDFQKVGYDKLSPQIVRLEWTQKDIYGFVARRLQYNYEKLQIKTPEWGYSPKWLDVDPDLKDQAREILSTRITGFTTFASTFGKALLLLSRIKLALMRKEDRSERRTNSLDEYFSKVVNFIFPNKSWHLTSSCKRDEILFGDFLGDHFKLGGNFANPRLILLFLQYTFEYASSYYDRNPDAACRTLNATDMDEYELILREHILRGYRRLQETTRETIIQLNLEWRASVTRLLNSLGMPKACEGLSVEQLKRMSRWEGGDDEFHRFIAFFTHVGLLVPESEAIRFETRLFSLPVVLRVCPNTA